MSVQALRRDGSYALGTATVSYPLSRRAAALDSELRLTTESGSLDMAEQSFTLRWGPDGGAERLGYSFLKPLALSDDGRTALLHDNRQTLFVWKEGGAPREFSDFLADYGLDLPAGFAGRLGQPVMSPDGSCFAGEGPGNAPDRRGVLACVPLDGSGEALEPPHWEVPEGYR